MELTKPELDVGIVPSDPQACIAFYRDVIGLRALPSVDLGGGLLQHRFVIGRHWIKLNQRAKTPPPQKGGIEAAVGIRLLAFLVDDLDALLGRIEAAGGSYSKFPVPDEAPYRVCFTNDPEGNVLELVGLRRPAGDALTARLQIGLTVSDVERSRDFYGRVLGLREEPVLRVGGAVGSRYGFVWGKTTVKFWALPDTPPHQTGAPDRHAGIRLFTAMVADLDRTQAQLEARGLTPCLGPIELPGIARLLFVADPDDNWIEFAQRL